ncbi:MAG: hypothetical protein OXF51_08840, partial [Alphaproteobacteria bacterium]|nr:hypothetical protein [Alphaproteobacteria bacterium]
MMPAVTLAGALALAGCGGGSDSPMKKDPPGGDGCDEGEIEYNGSCMTAAEIEAAGVKKGEENASMNTAKAERAKALVDVLGNVGKNNATPPVPADVDLNAQTYDTNGPAIVGNTIASVLKKGSDSLTAGTIGGYSYSGEGAGGSKLSGAIFAIGKTEEQEDIKDAAGAAAAAGLVGVSWNTDVERLVIGTGLPAAEVSGFEISESSGLEAGQNSPAVGKRFAGELYGLPGHYLCVVDTCMVTIVSSGTTLSDAGWVFEPTGGGSAKVSSAVADNLRFGWWITEDKEGEITQVDLHVVGGGADGDADGYARRSASISSKATYTGGAAGQYAHHSDDSSDYG